MFAARCRGEAFAITGIHAFMPKHANASPLRFQKTKVLPFFTFTGIKKDKAKAAFNAEGVEDLDENTYKN